METDEGRAFTLVVLWCQGFWSNMWKIARRTHGKVRKCLIQITFQNCLWDYSVDTYLSSLSSLSIVTSDYFLIRSITICNYFICLFINFFQLEFQFPVGRKFISDQLSWSLINLHCSLSCIFKVDTQMQLLNE